MEETSTHAGSLNDARGQAALVAPAPLDAMPGALLLDFGGVIVTTHKRPEGRREFSQWVEALLQRAGVGVSAPDIEKSLAAGLTALKYWKHSSSRRREPRELTVSELIEDFYFSDLEDPARAILAGHGAELMEEMALTLTEHRLREGVLDLLQAAGSAGIRVGIVSNAHSGRSHRRLLDDFDLTEHFGVQLYSDEAGIRKPHPHIIHRAADALGVPASRCWYVGDTMDRDLVAGRRAGVGAVVLTRSQHTDRPPFEVQGSPDAVVENPAELLGLLERAVSAGNSKPAGSNSRHGGNVGPAAKRNANQAGAPQRRNNGKPRQNQVILLDHGGVVSHTVTPETPFLEAAKAVEQTLDRAGCPLPPGGGLHLVQVAHSEYKKHKKSQDEDERFREVTPELYWGEFTRCVADAQQREALLAESHELQLALYRSKSHKAERDGIRRLLEHCRQTARPVIIVSNTINGRGVRGILKDYALDGLISGWVCSDEFGLKKPHPEIFRFALRMAGAEPEHAVMVGDKPYNDAFGAMGAGIGRRIITQGGSGTEQEITEALAEGWITDLVDDPGQIADLLA